MMDFPPRGGSRTGERDELEIDFGPLRSEEREPRPRRQRRPSPRRPPRRAARARGRRSETAARVLWVLPWIVFAVAVIAVGGALFAITMAALACLGLAEVFRMTASAHPFRLVGFAVGIGLSAAAFPLLFAASAARPSRGGITISLAVTVFAIAWIAIPFAHAVLLRELPHHGGALLLDVLIGTFLTDTCAYFGGRLFGRHPLAPRLSPNKTVEGLALGICGGTFAFWFAGLYQDWLTGIDALAIGFCVAVIAPVGDLFESMVKRDLGVKDTGRVFGPHGGLLDRLDAILFTIVVGYYLAVAFVY
jgi:phosphatidate cytidylyltransferase